MSSDTTWEHIEGNLVGASLPRAARRRRRLRAVVVATVVIVVAAGVALGFFATDSVRSMVAVPLPGWASDVGVVLQGGALVAWVIGGWRLARSGDFASAGPYPLAGLPRRERTNVQRMARGAVPFPEHRAALVRAVARWQYQQSAVPVFVFPGFLFLWAGNFLSGERSLFPLIALVALIVFAVLWVVALRSRAELRSFLRRTEPTAPREATDEGEPTPGS